MQTRLLKGYHFLVFKYPMRPFGKLLFSVVIVTASAPKPDVLAYSTATRVVLPLCPQPYTEKRGRGHSLPIATASGWQGGGKDAALCLVGGGTLLKVRDLKSWGSLNGASKVPCGLHEALRRAGHKQQKALVRM